jgi:hypothetical protein
LVAVGVAWAYGWARRRARPSSTFTLQLVWWIGVSNRRS